MNVVTPKQELKAPKSCPACGVSKDFPRAAVVEGQEGEEFDLYRCSKCGLLFVYLVPETQCHFHHELDWKPVQQESCKRAKRDYFQKALKICGEDLPPASRIFDFACGFGHFLAVASEAGYYVEGVDISPGCRQYIAKHLPNVTIYSELGKVPSDIEKFDLITAFEILYYLPSPGKTLEELQRLLRPSGKIFVTASANRGWLIWMLSYIKRSPVKLNKDDWMTNSLLNGRAYYGFSSRSLVELLESAGFTELRLARLALPPPNKPLFRILSLIWRGCVRTLRALTLGKIDIDTKVNIIGRYAPSQSSRVLRQDSMGKSVEPTKLPGISF